MEGRGESGPTKDKARVALLIKSKNISSSRNLRRPLGWARWSGVRGRSGAAPPGRGEKEETEETAVPARVYVFARSIGRGRMGLGRPSGFRHCRGSSLTRLRGSRQKPTSAPTNNYPYCSPLAVCYWRLTLQSRKILGESWVVIESWRPGAPDFFLTFVLIDRSDCLLHVASAFSRPY
jgi:hypothetical protein